MIQSFTKLHETFCLFITNTHQKMSEECQRAEELGQDRWKRRLHQEQWDRTWCVRPCCSCGKPRVSSLPFQVISKFTKGSSKRDLQSLFITSSENAPIKKQCILKWYNNFNKRDKVLWTGKRAATHWATRTTNFLPCRITIVARTRRESKQTSSEEGLW